jgi:hypothetical protein
VVGSYKLVNMSVFQTYKVHHNSAIITFDTLLNSISILLTRVYFLRFIILLQLLMEVCSV